MDFKEPFVQQYTYATDDMSGPTLGVRVLQVPYFLELGKKIKQNLMHK